MHKRKNTADKSVDIRRKVYTFTGSHIHTLKSQIKQVDFYFKLATCNFTSHVSRLTFDV